MMQRIFFCLLLGFQGLLSLAPAAPKPNIIFILADDLGYGDLGCYGQKLIQTPHLDRMAAEGVKFTQFYAGATVCAPSRSVLMTGLHHGHTRVRGNGGGLTGKGQQLRAEDVTVAEVLHEAGYATALIGKWGLGEQGTEGAPNAQGFDYFYGYTDQTHAHNHYPNFLWRNTERVALPNDLTPVGKTEGAGYSTNRAAYAGDLFAEEALDWIDRQATGAPFFLYLSLVMPHANNERARAMGDGSEVPSLAPYQDEPWDTPTKGYAAMITLLDGYVGRILERLRERGIDEKTLVFFSSDNGPHREARHDAALFQSSGPFRGWKRSLTDGGIRVPFIARWPGHIPPGTVSRHVGHFSDFLATASQLAGFDPPSGLDSISFAPALQGRDQDQPAHEALYWEFQENPRKQAVLIDGRWKVIRERTTTAPKPGAKQAGDAPPPWKTMLYDLQTDPGETTDLSAEQPARMARAEALFHSERGDSADWPAP